MLSVIFHPHGWTLSYTAGFFSGCRLGLLGITKALHSNDGGLHVCQFQSLHSSLCDCIKATSVFCCQSSAGSTVLSTEFRAFSVAGLMTWNSLPRHLRDPVHTICIFAHLLKTFLFFFLSPRHGPGIICHWIFIKSQLTVHLSVILRRFCSMQHMDLTN